MKALRNFAVVLSIFALLTFVGCSGGGGSSHSAAVPPGEPPPEPVPNAEITGYWYMELGINIDDMDVGPLMMTPLDEGIEEGLFNLIVEFPILEQDEDGSFSYTGPVSILGIMEEEATIEGQVDGNSITATVTSEEFTMSFTGTVDGNTIIGTWTLEEGAGPEIAVQGMELKTMAEAGVSGPFTVVISQTPHVPPNIEGIWEILEMVVDEDGCGLSEIFEELPGGFMGIFQEGWVFWGEFESASFYGVVYLDGSVRIIGWVSDMWFGFEGTFEEGIIEGTFEIQGEDCITTGTIVIQVHPYGDDYTIAGDLNLDPGASKNVRFEMQTPSGLIDRDTLKDNGPTFSYEGPATELKIKVKGPGTTLIVNGLKVQMAHNVRYTMTSSDMEVYLRNTVDGEDFMGHWWIEVVATGTTIEPDPFE